MKTAGIQARLLMASLLILSVSSLYVIGKASIADTMQLRSRWLIQQWQKGLQPMPTPAEWGETREQLSKAQRLTPEDPGTAENLAYLYRIQANRLKAIPDLYQAMLDESSRQFKEAVRLRPMAPYAWVNLAYNSHLQGRIDSTFWQAYDRAMRYGQREPALQKILIEIGYSHWDQLGEERRQGLQRMIDTASPGNRAELLKVIDRTHPEKPLH